MPLPSNTHGIARILKCAEEGAGERHAGMAIIVGARHVITCCHVVNDALCRRNRLDPERPSLETRFAIRFPYVSNVEGWGSVVAWGLADQTPKDIAVIELEEGAPREAGLAAFSEDEVQRHKWTCIGRDAYEKDREAEGMLGAILPRGDRQLNGPDGVAVRIEGGYSGAGVWSDASRAFVGMVVTKDADHSLNGAAYAITARTLRQFWPHLPQGPIGPPASPRTGPEAVEGGSWRRSLEQFLASAFPKAELRRLVVHNDSLALILNTVNWDSAISDVVDQMVTALEARNLINEDFFRILVLERDLRRGEIDAVQRLHAAAHLEVGQAFEITVVPEDLPGEPCKAHIIEDDLFVLDRTDLCDKISRFRTKAAQKCIALVRGGPESGKTHCRYLFELAAARHDGAKAVYLDRDLVPTVDDAIKELFDAVDASDKIPEKPDKPGDTEGGALDRPRPHPTPPCDSTDKAWYGSVFRELKKIAVDQKLTLWIVVDDLGADSEGVPLIDEDVRKFFDQLVLQMKNPAFRKPFRLMLIHYPGGKLPTGWDRNVLIEETTSETDIQSEHVADLLKLCLKKYGLGLTEAAIEKHAAGIISRADAPAPAPVEDEEPSPRLKRIHNEVIKVLRDLRRPRR